MLRPPTVLLLLSAFAVAVAADLAGDTSALLALRNAVGRSALPSWSSSNSTCLWHGVTCEAGRVVVLRLPGVGLRGELADDTFANLTALRTLSLRFNELSGAIPSSVASLVELRNLYLQHNNFSGALPAGLFLLPNLVRLNVAGNSLSGEIPASVTNLKRLGTLYLEDNAFTGELPAVDVPTLQQFNASFNGFDGPIPAALRRWPKDAFLGMERLCGGPLEPCSGELSPSPAEAARKRRLSGGAIAGIVVGCAVAVVLLVALGILLCRRNSGENRSVAATTVKERNDVASSDAAERAGATPRAINGSSAAANGAIAGKKAAPSGVEKRLQFVGPMAVSPAFDLEGLLRSSAEVLGKGAFGTTYKAVLENGGVVAVKRLKDIDLPEQEFRDRIAAIGAVQHELVVPLRAYYYGKDEKLLVYDYMSNGSLSALLHGNKASKDALDWDVRLAFALQAARGVEYIHSLSPASSHGNIKLTNVLLTDELKARVSDHGLPTLAGPSFSAAQMSGYRAPEVTDIRRVSQKADVYSFGVLLLELLTGKSPSHPNFGDTGVDLPRWVQSVVREEWTEDVFDPEIRGPQNAGAEEEIKLLQLAVECAAQHPDQRPTMAEATARIEAIRRMAAVCISPDGSSPDGSSPDGA